MLIVFVLNQPVTGSFLRKEHLYSGIEAVLGLIKY